MLWAGRSAIEIATAVRQGEVKATTVVEEHLHVISERDPKIGAFRRVREQAVHEARLLQKRRDLADLPLAGVPVAVKDNLEVAGEATRGGSAATPDRPAHEDHATVARLRAAGAVIVGLTNLPELGLVALGDSAYGIVRNPWNTGRTAGGSSSGSAAAVAAGMVPIALGNDGMGSLRIPAACCGVLAIKPGTGLVPAPADDWERLTENGPLATTAADLALALSVLAADPALAEAWRGGRRVEPPPRMLRSVWADDDEVWEPQPPPASPEPFDLRVAYAPQPLPPGMRMDKEFAAAVRGAAETLRVAGHTVVEHERRLPVWLGPATIATWLVRAAEAAEGLDRLERRTTALARAGRTLRALGLDGVRGRERWSGYGADQWFGEADALITPALAAVPPKAERWGERGFVRNAWKNVTYAPTAGPWNMCGWPAISVPVATHSSALPIGVQIVAPPGGEPHLLGLAAQLQEAHPPLRPPGFSF
uniref:Aspartyl-tRNA(Asn) amidotransferase subunit A @ Glutamyl-tRNA(Gln) amidotransferase subunit A n=2 Tax=Nonomuraea gerenzanensis TaxID=93944 RepID=A0A1M4DYV1_9ACTN|nr:Aspartyl-tRNA(Asn) amidotransferase subunit A @ Glutamyl-tRNA(Gln) amidotransferase subunit A [Nonomuraea gerenzanensis]